MKEKVCVVTGGNAGIGKAIASELARMQAHVVIVSRNREKGELALADIRQEAPMGQVELVVGDLGTAAGTRQLANTLLAQLPHIHVLVNNAGVWLTQRQLNVDGLEMTFMVNHLAPFILTNMLLARLQASTPARIVNVNAGLYVNGRFNLQQTPYGHDFHRLRTYANSKLGNIFYTQELARRIEGSGVTVNAVHPGVIRTDLGVMSGVLGWLLRLVKRSWPGPEVGAQAPVWLATAPELEAVNGKYFDLKQETPYAPVAQNPELAQQVWALSEQLAG
ncbi:MAG: SDR family oxidoreductase [Chloroflexota bacterium]